ncbi:MAG: hypothetical protein H7259_10005 [Cytophagales bacterium]|nr:hypothetical protein [Cytophaga sp.]
MKTYKKVLVIGLMGDKAQELRSDMETNMANALRAQGVLAYSAFATYGPMAFQEHDPRSALLDVADYSFDAIVCMVLIDKDKEQYYTPPTTSYVPNYYNNYNGGYYNNYNGFSNYYNQSYNRVTTPGYYTTTTDYTIETDIFNFPKDSLIYSAETKTYNPSDLLTMSTEVSKAIVADMMNKGVLPFQKK